MSQKLRADLKSDIANGIIKNGQGGITAPILNSILTNIADSAYIKGDDVITGGSGGTGGGITESASTYLKSLPDDPSGLAAGDLYWNGDALFRNGDGLGGSGGFTLGGSTVTAFLDSLLNSLPTTTPTTSGTWWNDNGTFARTP